MNKKSKKNQKENASKLDNYLSKLEKSINNNSTKVKSIPNSMNDYNFPNKFHNYKYPFITEIFNDQQPSTSGDENLSSSNSQTAMLRRSSNLDIRRSNDRLNKNNQHPYFSSHQNLSNFSQFSSQNKINNSSFNSNFDDPSQNVIKNEHHIIDNVDDDDQDSVQFTTPFEFKNSSKKLNRSSSRSRYLKNYLPTIELKWRNLCYFAKKVKLTGKERLTNIKMQNGKRMILDKQNGELQGGELVAIIGPSGAGKSTLLECLAGRRTLNMTGTININYSSDYLDKGERVKISFIAQKDNVIGLLTVREILMFASRIKNNGKIKNSYYHPRLVKSVLKELGLDKCANIPSNKISGGQLKRLSFAMELISGPDILLLDEPTSGLDSSSAASIIQLLRKLTDLRQMSRNVAYKPPAIICSIHQPSARVLLIFHKIYILSNDGRCVFNGSPHLLLSHLAKLGLHCPQFHNPADFIVEIASGDYGVQPINILAKNNRPSNNEMIGTEDHSKNEKLKEELLLNASRRHDSQLNNESLSSDNSTDYPMNKRMISVKVTKVLRLMKQQKFPVFLHFYLLLKRTYITTSRDPKLTWFRILQALFIGLVMAFLYDYPIGKDGGCILDSVDNNSTNTTHEDDFSGGLNSKTQDNIAFIFFITLFTVMAAMMPTVLTFPAEVAILIQERNNGWYSCWTYYWTKIIADTPYQFIVTVTFCGIVYPTTGQPWIWWRFALFNLISLLVAMIAQSVGILFGTIYVRSVETAVFMAPLSMAPVFLISGFFAKINKLPVFLKPIAIISYVRYAFESFLVSLYGFNRCEDVPLFLDSNGVFENLAYNPVTNIPKNKLDSSENRKSYSIKNLPAKGSRAKFIFRKFPNYASEFPKVWTGFYNPVAYAQMMERQNLFSSNIVSTEIDSSTPPPSMLEDYSDNFAPQQPPINNLFGLDAQNSTGSLTDINSAFPTGNYVLNHFSLKDETLTENLIILTFILFILRLAGYLLLVYKTNQKR